MYTGYLGRVFHCLDREDWKLNQMHISWLLQSDAVYQHSFLKFSRVGTTLDQLKLPCMRVWLPVATQREVPFSQWPAKGYYPLKHKNEKTRREGQAVGGQEKVGKPRSATASRGQRSTNEEENEQLEGWAGCSLFIPRETRKSSQKWSSKRELPPHVSLYH